MAPRSSPTESEKRRPRILDEVLRDHGDELRRQASKHSQRPENDGDALDDACVSFLRFYEGPPGIPALRYMMVVVRTSAWAIDRQRRELEIPDGPRIFHAGLKMDPLATITDPGDEPEEQYQRLEELRERAAPLAFLKRDERIALVLLAAGFTYRDICDRQGWTYTKVNRCIAEGRQHLAELLGEGRGS